VLYYKINSHHFIWHVSVSFCNLSRYSCYPKYFCRGSLALDQQTTAFEFPPKIYIRQHEHGATGGDNPVPGIWQQTKTLGSKGLWGRGAALRAMRIQYLATKTLGSEGLRWGGATGGKDLTKTIGALLFFSREHTPERKCFINRKGCFAIRLGS
jgi:hypothetical protein